MFNNAQGRQSQHRISAQKFRRCLALALFTASGVSPVWSQESLGEMVGVVSLPPALRAAHPDAFKDADPASSTLQGVAEPVPVDAPAEAGETLDRYAERLLKQRLDAKDAVAPVDLTQPATELPKHIGTLGPANLDLIYIAGTAARSQAYVRIDKRYAKLMRVGEYVAGWRLRGIGVDYVDIVKDDEQARLYLFSSRFEVKDLNAGRSGVY